MNQRTEATYHGTIIPINGWVLVQSPTLRIYAHDPEGHVHQVLSGGQRLTKDNAFKFLCAIDRDLKGIPPKKVFHHCKESLDSGSEYLEARVKI